MKFKCGDWNSLLTLEPFKKNDLLLLYRVFYVPKDALSTRRFVGSV